MMLNLELNQPPTMEEDEMNTMTEVDVAKIIAVKKALKELTTQQVRDKKQLRTDHSKIVPAGLGTASHLQGKTFSRAVEITAHLNYRRVLVGKAPCHGIREGWLWMYDKTMKQLTAE